MYSLKCTAAQDRTSSISLFEKSCAKLEREDVKGRIFSVSLDDDDDDELGASRYIEHDRFRDCEGETKELVCKQKCNAASEAKHQAGCPERVG